MVAASKHARALERPQIIDLLDHADLPIVALGIGADPARIGGVEIATARAFADLLSGVSERARKTAQ